MWFEKLGRREKNMIIIRVMGGLGNQMQQYALYEKFRSLGKEAKLDISWFEDAAQQENVLAKRSLELRQFENLQFESEVYAKLQEAEREAELTDRRYSSKDVLKAMRDAIGGEPVV